jgi:hypothetical protein
MAQKKFWAIFLFRFQKQFPCVGRLISRSAIGEIAERSIKGLTRSRLCTGRGSDIL